MSNRRKLRCRGGNEDKGHIMPTTLDDEGHNTVTLEGPRGTDVRRVCELVAETFIGPCPPEHQVEHVNGDLTDDNLVNLRYVPKAS